jgi:cysteinyl-tRNA synthetase
MRQLKIYNTLGRKIEPVEPIKDGKIGIYSCGLTVYDYAHIGNLRKYIFDDLLVRTLRNFGYAVKHVMNITDVGHLTDDGDGGEDKMEKGAAREGKTAWEIAKFFENAFLQDFDKLNIVRPDIIPRATEHIKQQIELIQKLEQKGFTYTIDDGVYFDTSKLKDYGKLAGLDLKSLREGARVEKNEQKKNPTDFALWKFSPKGSKRQMQWLSPWTPSGSQGKVMGFPGWHIECSAMSTKYLGQPFEIHTGGIDHIPVHHTNEIAQSEAAEGKSLAKYWVHSEFVLEDGHKMSKSDGHFVRLNDLVKKGYDPLDFRYLVLSAHYRSKLDFSFDSLDGAKSTRKSLINFVQKAVKENSSEQEETFYDLALGRFESDLENDLDTPKALAVVFETISKAYESDYLGPTAQKFIKRVDGYLALNLIRQIYKYKGIVSSVKLDDDLLDRLNERSRARESGNFDLADQIKREIIEKGYKVDDQKDYTGIDKI